MSKGVKKLAVIRENSDVRCPFGLSIPKACHVAGEYVDKMAPLEDLPMETTEEEKQLVAKANNKLLSWALMQDTTEIKTCKYLSSFFKDKSAVDCNWGDTAAGTPNSAALLGSPFYSRIFSGVGLDGLYSYPIGWYADYNISRNLFYGIYSLQGGFNTSDVLIKIADSVLLNSCLEKAHINKNG